MRKKRKRSQARRKASRQLDEGDLRMAAFEEACEGVEYKHTRKGIFKRLPGSRKWVPLCD